ncbi:hypothetical protein AwPolaro_08290 [Polaromonas sp.]|nr:hypothetical protein AwPolaro_08290 [Polaromonas sp.]
MSVISEHTLFVGLAFNAGTEALTQALPEVVPAGVLKLVRRGNVETSEFAYGRQYLRCAKAEPLNPEHLPLQQAVFDWPGRRLRDGGAMPLTIRDALPDSWGRRVLDATQGQPVSDVQALLLTNADRVGAMVFSDKLPIHPAAPESKVFKLEELAEAARQFEMGLETDAAIKRLLQGGSLGGARPKATFIHANQRHIAKFPARGDDHDVALLEAATLQLAMACGISVPLFFLHRLPTGHALVLKRFDRDGPIGHELRFHYLSASAVLNVAYEDNAGGSYVALAQALRRISAKPDADLQELYRRLIFNLVVGNSDDHVKNHGVLLQGKGYYRLAPAFDVVMQLNGHTGYQSLAILPGEMESSLALARQAAVQFGLTALDADAIIGHISATVQSLAETLLKASGANDALVRRVRDFLARQRLRINAARLP